MTETACDESREQLYTPPTRSIWLPIFAVLYDPFLWVGEIAGMRRRRRTLLRAARGRVVEIGAGTGLNATYYPDEVTDLTLTEPDSGMRRKLTRRVTLSGRSVHISDASAEHLPFADACVDTVVSTLVLCTVPDPERALREIARVLRPDGQLLFIEHIRSGNRFLGWLQDRLRYPWRAFAAGCVCNRSTAELLRSCGFTVTAEDATWRGMPAIVLPLIIGRAVRCGPEVSAHISPRQQS